MLQCNQINDLYYSDQYSAVVVECEKYNLCDFKYDENILEILFDYLECKIFFKNYAGLIPLLLHVKSWNCDNSRALYYMGIIKIIMSLCIGECHETINRYIKKIENLSNVSYRLNISLILLKAHIEMSGIYEKKIRLEIVNKTKFIALQYLETYSSEINCARVGEKIHNWAEIIISDDKIKTLDAGTYPSSDKSLICKFNHLIDLRNFISAKELIDLILLIPSINVNYYNCMSQLIEISIHHHNDYNKYFENLDQCLTDLKGHKKFKIPIICFTISRLVALALYIKGFNRSKAIELLQDVVLLSTQLPSTPEFERSKNSILRNLYSVNCDYQALITVLEESITKHQHPVDILDLLVLYSNSKMYNEFIGCYNKYKDFLVQLKQHSLYNRLILIRLKYYHQLGQIQKCLKLIAKLNISKDGALDKKTNDQIYKIQQQIFNAKEIVLSKHFKIIDEYDVNSAQCLQNAENKIICGICYDEIFDISVTLIECPKCYKYVAHLVCMATWLLNNTKCPNCNV